MRKLIYIFMALALATGLTVVGRQSSAMAQDSGPEADDIVALGKAIFFDTNLSANGTQSCATCHAPGVGFTGSDSLVNAGGAVYEGAIPNHYGNRKPPASAYAGDGPELYYDETEDAWFGGMFW